MPPKAPGSAALLLSSLAVTGCGAPVDDDDSGVEEPTVTGDTVTFHREGPNNTDDDTAVVGPGVEIEWVSALIDTHLLDFDVTDTGMVISAVAPGAIFFGGDRGEAYFEISDIDWTNDAEREIVAIDVDLSNWGLNSTGPSDFEFDDHALRWLVGGTDADWTAGDDITITWETAP